MKTIEMILTHSRFLSFCEWPNVKWKWLTFGASRFFFHKNLSLLPASVIPKQTCRHFYALLGLNRNSVKDLPQDKTTHDWVRNQIGIQRHIVITDRDPTLHHSSTPPLNMIKASLKLQHIK